jgi:hypothetical protein
MSDASKVYKIAAEKYGKGIFSKSILELQKEFGKEAFPDAYVKLARTLHMCAMPYRHIDLEGYEQKEQILENIKNIQREWIKKVKNTNKYKYRLRDIMNLGNIENLTDSSGFENEFIEFKFDLYTHAKYVEMIIILGC